MHNKKIKKKIKKKSKNLDYAIFSYLFVFWKEIFYKTPKIFGVIFFFDMTDFVYNHIFKKNYRQMNKFEIERNIICMGVGSLFMNEVFDSMSQSTQNLLTDMIAQYEKEVWMMKAMTK